MKTVIDLIIFDCDGVLIDSEILGITLALEMLNHHGINMDFHEFSSQYSGLSWNALIDKIQHQKGVRLPASIGNSFYTALQEIFATSLRRIDGSLELLTSLNIPYCICSNSSGSQLNYALSLVQLEHFFADRIFSAVDLGSGRGKPQPDIFLYAAKVFNASPQNTLVIEDSVPGVTAAKKAGMHVTGFIGGGHTYPQHADRLLAAGADMIITSLDQFTPEIMPDTPEWNKTSFC
ncbi:MAG: 6-phosphogluconate phosphatase [Candidatus Erwinia impunctatus]|nr:6-phosphogluconate phosphatase [Culicoides impunctatus]